MAKKKISIIGGGSWGLALAAMFARANEQVSVYVRDQKELELINKSHISSHLAEVNLPNNIIAIKDFDEALNSELIIIATPARSFCEIIEKLQAKLDRSTILLVASKGMCDNPLQLFSDKINATLDNKFAFIYGPNFAYELVAGKDSFFTIAAEETDTYQAIAKFLKHDSIKIEYTQDIVTAQIASMAKNIFAIKSGMLQAANISENQQAALLTQSLKEIAVIAKSLGGKPESQNLYCVVGDLALTCYSNNSRNTKFGYELHQNNYDPNFIKQYPLLIEGVYSAKLLGKFLHKLGIKTAIIDEISKLVEGC